MKNRMTPLKFLIGFWCCIYSIKGINSKSINKTNIVMAAFNGRPDTISVHQNASWIDFMKLLRHNVKTCEKFSQNTTWICLKKISLRMLDNVVSSHRIKLYDGIHFIRSEKNSSNFDDNKRQRKDFQYLTWLDLVSLNFSKFFKTHVLEINLREASEHLLKSLEQKGIGSNSSDVGTARMRRHRYNMLITMMFGATALGAILIPMGFQLLSIVSGKALLMAKMALLLASINGLKRVANSGVHYGLYHVPGEHYGYYDRGDAHHPRTVQATGVEISQPFEFGLK